jgi:hypothetical protein
MAETNERIEELRAKVDEARERLNAAQREFSLTEAALHEARGETFEARWSRAIAVGDHVTAHACWLESCARRVIDGRASPEDYERSSRIELAAVIERLRAEAH